MSICKFLGDMNRKKGSVTDGRTAVPIGETLPLSDRQAPKKSKKSDVVGLLRFFRTTGSYGYNFVHNGQVLHIQIR